MADGERPQKGPWACSRQPPRRSAGYPDQGAEALARARLTPRCATRVPFGRESISPTSVTSRAVGRRSGAVRGRLHVGRQPDVTSPSSRRTTCVGPRAAGLLTGALGPEGRLPEPPARACDRRTSSTSTSPWRRPEEIAERGRTEAAGQVHGRPWWPGRLGPLGRARAAP